MIATALWMLRFAGMRNDVIHETPGQVVERRKTYLPELARAGYTVRKITPYQFRIDDRLDVYPTNARWHDIKTGKRGGFEGKNLARFVRTYFKEI